MGCGGSKVNAVDAEAVDGRDTELQSPGNGVKTSINEESDPKAVQFSAEIKSNGVPLNEGKITIKIKIYRM